ncbi:DUF4386 domain-containing protein [Algoriphagus kandeliae]|uniref:DUF4386 domain-containing protein n=1 Tax=Algoriphagus kandeliae TaxID=2562278 RepID=A0A4Y9QTK7_9BACT|nr:DUF4386 domain-containing protein [Algoriphagus kandeliae]TFV94533.1 DUF4386 domain-containing protein [Algoriphagus kandeliae]
MSSTQKKNALLTGVSLLLMAGLAGYSYGFVYQQLVITGDEVQTVQNIRNSLDQFHYGIAGWVGILILDIMVAFGFFRIFQSQNFRLSLASAILRIAYCLFLVFAINQLKHAAQAISVTSSGGDVMAFLAEFEKYWSQGLIVFGLHLIGIGILSWQSTFIPKILAGLATFAGFCYFVIHGTRALFPSWDSVLNEAEMYLALPMGLGEIALAIWLIVVALKSK